jgi:putative nucleotidyltransferase with HDIG domain
MQSLARASSLVRAYVAVIVVLAIAAIAASVMLEIAASNQQALSVLGILAFVGLGFGLQLAELRLAVGTVHSSISFIIYIGSGLVFGPAWAALITGVSVGGAQLIGRKPVIKVVFNVAQHVVAIVVGGLVYVSLGGPIPPRPIDEAVLPFVGFLLVFFAVNSVAVSGVVAISEGRPFKDVWIRNTWGMAVYDLVAGALALGIAWLYLELQVVGLALVVAPLLFLRHTYFVNLQLQATNRELLDLMVKAIEARDPYTSGHSQRVSELARALAKEMGLSFEQAEEVSTAALLHDVGKIYDEFAPVLRKEGTLTREERILMQTHVERSAELVGTISNLRGRIQSYVRHHHEHFDGSGYPDGLAGPDIPVGSRLIMIADTTDAMTTDRPYRVALGFEEVIKELRRCSGTQFDPALVETFCRSAAVRRVINTWRLRPVVRPEEAPEKPGRLALQ